MEKQRQMKKFEELTKKEILALTDEQVDYYVKYDIIKEGVKIIPKPISPVYNKVPKEDMTVYKIGILGDGIVFSDFTEAENMCNLLKHYYEKDKIHNLRQKGDYGSYTYHLDKANGGYGHESDKFIIITYHCYSENLSKECKDLINQNNNLKKEYEALLKEYNRYVDDKQEISNSIWDKVYEVRDEEESKKEMLRVFKEEYLSIEPDFEKAFVFFKKVYTISSNMELYMRRNLGELNKKGEGK